MFLTIGVLATSCAYDESELGGQLDNIKNRIEELKTDIETINGQLASLNEIANGNPVTAVTQDTDGKYVITYKDRNNEEKSVVLATMDQQVKVPMVGVKVDEETGMNCWTLDGEFMLKNGQKIPVSGFAPNVSVDEQGYWIIDGERIKDFNGNDVYAHSGESSLFESITTDADGDLVITQGNGEVITIPVQGAINLTLSAGVNTTVINANQSITINYDVVGINAKDAMVAIADAQGVTATMDREAKTITVGFPSSFTSGYLLVVAYDLEEHTVLRPVFFTVPGGDVGGGDPEQPLDYIAIYNAQQLVQFASDVNAGAGMEKMEAKLMNDIDMAGVTSWTPIGHCVAPWSLDNTATYWNKVVITSGTPFKGHFDGQGFTIKNFKMTCSNSVVNKPYGMFGTLAEGAVVENINFDSSCSITSSPTAGTDCGLVAGLVWSSSVKNITNRGAITYSGNGAPDNVRQTLAMIGLAYADNNNVTIENLKNTGAIVSKNSGHNTKNGATGVQVAGILGFGTNGVEGAKDAGGASMTGYVNVVNCTNDGQMTSDAARTSGIVAAANRFTFIDGCTNNGDQMNTHAISQGGRLGNITCITGSGSKLRNCTNNGDLISSTSARIGGVVGFVNHNSCTIESCHNTGDIISDYDAGLLFGYDNVTASFTNCSVSGRTGTYNGGSYSMNNVTTSNYITSKYVGNYGANATSYVTNTAIRYVGENAVGIKSAADMVEFANLVNSGQSYAKFQDENGTVNLLKDIDMSSVTTWTPIGYATCPAGAVDAVITGNAFAGSFNGNGFKFTNFKMVANGSEAGKNFGLFGTLAPGAVVQNFSFDESCSLEVKSTASMACGLIAGYAFEAEIRDIKSSAKMTFNGKAGDSKFMSMALIGQVYCDTNGVIVDSVDNAGEIIANNTDNLQNNASAYHAAGIVGFAHAKEGSAKRNNITTCMNSGNMTSYLARTSGIVGAANRCTNITYCDNRGDQINSFATSGNARLGNIVCIVGSSGTVSNCTNYGDLISKTSARCGGIVYLPNKTTFVNCSNYGEILTDDANRGLFFGFNGNGNASVWKGCTAGGKVGTYNNGTPVYDSYTDDQRESYLGKFGNTNQTYEAITYLIGTSEPPAGGDADLNILFIGNSFTLDSVEHLPGILDAVGNSKVNMTLMYWGGGLIGKDHVANYSTGEGYTCYTCSPGQKAWTAHTKGSISTAKVVKDTKWDIVTIQEHTGNSVAWSWTSTEKEHIMNLINKVKSDLPSGSTPKFYYIMSQAYYNMNKIGSGSKPYITWTDQVGMYNVIVDFAKKVMAECPFDGIIATGTMLQNLRTSSANTTNDSTRDGYHMDWGLARYGASCTVFETLITPKFTTTLDNCSFTYSKSDTSVDSYSTPVTAANAPIALQAARYAIQNPYQITDMSVSGTVDGGIDDAAEFLAFLQAVNAGSSLADYMNTDREVVLKANIDLSSITNAQWQAIADGTSVKNNTYDNTISAGAFTGVFNGNSKKITGFNPTVTLGSGKTFGLIPVINGGTVKNLEVSGAMVVSASAVADAGMVCGTGTNAKFTNVKVSGTINSAGTSVSDKRFSIGGICGYANATDGNSVTFENCTSGVTATIVGGSNTTNGASSAMYGGIVAYTATPNNETTSAKITISGCTNTGNMNVTLGRCSGIVATPIWNTTISNCTNNGNQVNAILDGRLGNIACVVGSGGKVTNCVNNGNIETTNSDYKGTVGGMLALIGTNNIQVSGGGNYGTVKTKSTASKKGLICAYFNIFQSVSNVTVSGKMYVDGTQQSITSSNFMDYAGSINSAHASKITGLTWTAPAN